LTLDGRPLTRLAAVDWTRVDRIPPLAEPARLPAGAGTALFNLLARLAVEQGVSVLRYDAPYPTEALFLALLESFRYVPADGGDIAVPTPPADPPEIAPLAPGVVAGLVATVVATSAAPLAPWIARAARDVAFEWGPVEADLVEARGSRVRLSHRLRRALAD